jgi:hypothetical protein
MKSLNRFLKLRLFLALIGFANVISTVFFEAARSQVSPSGYTLAPQPLDGSHSTYWIPDCSSGSAIDPHAKVHNYAVDNQGTPLLDFVTVDGITGLRRELSGVYDLGFDAVDDGSNGSIVVYEKSTYMAQVEWSSQTAYLAQTYSNEPNGVYGKQVFIQCVTANGAKSNTPIPAGRVELGVYTERLPKIVKASDGNYIVSFIQGEIETSNTPECMVMMKFSATTGAVLWGPDQDLAGYGGHIQEYTVAADQNGGAAVAYTSWYSPDTWNNVLIHYDDGVSPWTSGVYPPTTTYNWNPIVQYATETGQFDVLWGSNTGASSYIYGQTFTNAGSAQWISAIQLLSDPIATYEEFYAVSFAEPAYGSVTNSVEGIIYRDATNNLKVDAYDMDNSYPGTLWTAPYTLSHTGDYGCYPSAIMSDLNSPNHDLVVSWIDNPGYTGMPAGTVHITDFAAYYTGSPAWSNQTHLGITSWRFQGQLGELNDSIYALFPDVNGLYLRRCLETSGDTAGYIYCPARVQSSPSSLPVDGYGCLTVGSSQYNLLSYDDGLNTFQQGYFQKDREADACNSDIECRGYCGRSLHNLKTTPNFSSPLFLSYSPIQHALCSDVFHTTNAAVYEQWTPGAAGSDIYIDTRENESAFNPALKLTSAITPDTNYIRPKVAVLNYSGTNYAIVTYVKEYSILGFHFSQLCFRSVNLTTPLTLASISAETAIDQDDSAFGANNFALITDSLQGSALAIYGKGYRTFPVLGQNDLWAMQILFPGSLGWYSPERVSLSADGAAKPEVVACYDPTPCCSGVYVSWTHKIVSNHKIGLTHVASLGGTWAGPQILCDSTAILLSARQHPTVAASTTWVMAAWADSRVTAPRVYGCAFDITGALIPGWVKTGVLLDSASIPYTGDPDDPYESDYPSLAAADTSSSRQSCILAYAEDNDPDQDNFGVTGYVFRIGIREVPVDLNHHPLGFARQLAFNKAPTPSNSVTNSMFGYYQRAPKLLRIQPDGNYNPGMPMVVCGFETYAFSGSSWWPIDYSYGLHQVIRGTKHFFESNIAARLITWGTNAGWGTDTMNVFTVGQFCISSQLNAESLENMHWSSELGITAYYTDYNNSDNYTGDIQSVDMSNQTMTSGVVYNMHLAHTGLCGTARTGTAYQYPVIYNNSPMNLYLVNAVVPPPYSITPTTATIGAYNNQTLTLSYTPLFNCEFDPLSLIVSMKNISPSTGFYNGNMVYAFGLNGSGKIAAPGSGLNDAQFTVSINPNPAMNQARITFDGTILNPVTLQLYDVLGRQIWSGGEYKLSDGKSGIPIDLSGISPGSYILRIVHDGQPLERMVSIIH